MSVRKRTWTTNGETKQAWVVDYTDQHGDRHLKTFERKRDADAHHDEVSTSVRAGTRTADSKSIAVSEAAKLWLASCEAVGLEQSSIASYRQTVELRIVPNLGTLRLSQLPVPRVRAFEDKLAADGCSPVMVRRARTLLGALIADAQERGKVAQNVVHALRSRRKGKDATGQRRRKRKLKVGVDIPTPDEMRAIIASLPGLDEAARFRPLLLTAIFTGLRASELRGLRSMSTSSAASCTFTSALIATRRSDDRSRKPASARCRCRRCWSPCCASISALVRRASLASSSRTAGAASIIAGSLSSADSNRRRSPRVSSTARATRSIPACTRCGTSKPRGASTGKSMVVWNCR